MFIASVLIMLKFVILISNYALKCILAFMSLQHIKMQWYTSFIYFCTATFGSCFGEYWWTRSLYIKNIKGDVLIVIWLCIFIADIYVNSLWISCFLPMSVSDNEWVRNSENENLNTLQLILGICRLVQKK